MTEKSSPLRLMSCPRCRRSVVYSLANPARPFCSQRCKDEDIISWAREEYKVEGGPKEDENQATDDEI